MNNDNVLQFAGLSKYHLCRYACIYVVLMCKLVKKEIQGIWFEQGITRYN
jgi:hypothetical protein